MNFNAPISLHQRSQFSEGSKLAPMRDTRNNSSLWKKDKKNQEQLHSAVQAMQKTIAQISKQRRKPLGGSKPVEIPETFFPFRIYKPVITGQAFGVYFPDPTTGIGVNIAINSNVPTDFTVPTVNPTTDAWRFFSVRSGQVEVRPIYSLLSVGGGPYYANGLIDLVSDPNNWGWKYTIGENADGVNPSFSDMEFDDPTMTTINAPLVIGGTIESAQAGGVSMLIWIQITPDTSDSDLPICKIAVVQSDIFRDSNWPNSSQNMIPVGIWTNNFGYNEDTGVFPLEFNAVQEIFDHQVNRFPCGNGNFSGVGGVMNFRGGYVDGSSDVFPTDLLSQIAYPGDIFSAQFSAGPPAVNGLLQYVYQSPFYIMDISPFGLGSGYLQFIFPLSPSPE